MPSGSLPKVADVAACVESSSPAGPPRRPPTHATPKDKDDDPRSSSAARRRGRPTGPGRADEVATAVVGAAEPLRTALAAILAGGHVLFEDVPGLGKTLAARSLAPRSGWSSAGCSARPTCSPPTSPARAVYDPATRPFAFRPGPVFAGLLLADEINRTAPKTQSALLEAMAERQVTVDGTTHRLPRPFHVVATSNPVEYEGTYPLPEAQLDRFMVRLAVGYPDHDERSTCSRAGSVAGRRRPRAQGRGPGDVLGMQAGVEAVDVDPDVLGYCVDLAAATRRHSAVEVGVSPRGAQSLLLVARAAAVLAGRCSCCPRTSRTSPSRRSRTGSR